MVSSELFPQTYALVVRVRINKTVTVRRLAYIFFNKQNGFFLLISKLFISRQLP